MPQLGEENRSDTTQTPSTLGSVDTFIGTVIDGRFKIKSRIARGGMATVYRAQDRRLERMVAVKIMHPHLADSADFVARFRREARIAAGITHPCVVAIHDQGVVGGTGYLVMELVEGPNLRTALKRKGSYSLGESLQIISQILQALNAAHNAGLIHRDMKPENVLIPPYGSVKVADFGLARAVSEATGASTGNVLGTVAYMAPEIITTGTADARTDIYATGVMLYELLTGHTPLQGSTPIQIAYQHVHEGLPDIRKELPWIPQEVSDLIAEFTNRDVSLRPENAAVAQAQVQDLLQSLSPEILEEKADVQPQLTQEETEEDFTEHDSLTTSALSYNHGTQALPVDKDLLAVKSDTIVAEQVPASAKDMQPYSKEPKTKLKSSKSKYYVTGGILAVLVAVVFGAWWFMLGPGAYTQVPDVAGLSVEEAKSKLSSVDIGFSEKYVYSDTVAQDKVVGTDPSSKVYRNSKVQLLISKGVQQIEVPDVAGLDPAEALKVLTNANLQVNKQNGETWSEEIEQGKVARTDVDAGTVIPHTQFVTILVSKGREPIQVPNIVGKSAEEAQRLVTEAGLKAEAVEDYSDTVAKGVVISQEQTPEQTLFRSDVVKYTVSKGPRTKPVPNVFGKSVEEATRILKEAGFEVNIVKVLGGAFGIVRSTDPAGGQQIQPGSTVTVTVI